MGQRPGFHRLLCLAAGFSIMESTVVLGAISIVAATAGPQLGEYLETARMIKVQGDVRVLKSTLLSLLNDVGRLNPRIDDPPPGLLVSDGDPPEPATETSELWALPVDGRAVQDLGAHLVDNAVGYEADRRSSRRWRGPYVEGLTADPWGTRYSINVGCLNAPGPGYVTLVVSAGPDGVIETPFRTTVLPVNRGDDVIALLSSGKSGSSRSMRPADRKRSDSQDGPNLCAGPGLDSARTSP